MSEYKRLSFKNHDPSATELVKFLAINTSFESIEKLLTKTATLECEILEMKKQVANSVKASSSAANKADESQKLCDALVKCVAKLEQKREGTWVTKFEEALCRSMSTSGVHIPQAGLSVNLKVPVSKQTQLNVSLVDVSSVGDMQPAVKLIFPQ
jgi:hypothetical protein